QIFDDRSGLDHAHAVVDQQGELAERPAPLELDKVLRMVLLEQFVLERSLIRPQGDQHLLAVGRERVGVELQAHQAPASIFSRRAISCSLGGLVSNVPVGTSPAGSKLVMVTPLGETKWSVSLSAP